MSHRSWPTVGLLALVVALPSPGAGQALRLGGVAYGAFREGQSPEKGVFPTPAEIAEDLAQLAALADRVRSYSVEATQGEILALARAEKLKLYAGAWVGRDEEANDAELARLLALAQRAKPAALVIGNEVLTRGDLSEADLVTLLGRAGEASKLPIAYADTWSRWLAHPDVADAVDILLVHVHPYWDGVAAASAAAYVIERFEEVKRRYPTKRVEIGETGWPTAGATVGAAVPGAGTQCFVLRDFVTRAARAGAPYFWFSAFDESWKSDATGLEAEAHWGLHGANRTAKPCVASFLAEPPPLVEITNSARCGGGPDSHGGLRGRAFGLGEARTDTRVVLYARTNTWTVQPFVDDPFTRIGATGRWKRGVHLGSRYAALLTSRDWQPPAITSALPDVGDAVLAIGEVDCGRPS